MSIIRKLEELGYSTVPEEVYTQIGLWKSWYDGYVKSFHHYRVYNGKDYAECRMFSLNMAKKVCQDWANLLMNEKVKITLEGKAEQEFFDQVCRDNNFWVKINEMQELKSALGTAAYVASVRGAEVKDGRLIGGKGSVKLDYVTAEHIFPLEWENGKITACAFATDRNIGKEKYVYLQIHQLLDEEYVIQNRVFQDQNGNLTEVALTSVKGFETVPPLVNTHSDRPQFVIDRLAIANNLDVSLPTGIAVFGNSIDSLMAADRVFDSYVNEFVLGKKRLMVRSEATDYQDGKKIFDPHDTVYYILPDDTKEGSLVQPIDMSLRVEEHHTGIQDQLNVISSQCGFGENHYRFENGNISTATQVVSENSTLFRTIKKHEIILNDVLVELARIILRLGNTVLEQGLREDVEISIDFDDSIIEDKATDFTRDMQLLNAGIMNDWEFRMKWMNEDEATAKAALPKMEDMTEEEEDEIE